MRTERTENVPLYEGNPLGNLDENGNPLGNLARNPLGNQQSKKYNLRETGKEIH